MGGGESITKCLTISSCLAKNKQKQNQLTFHAEVDVLRAALAGADVAAAVFVRHPLQSQNVADGLGGRRERHTALAGPR